MFCLLLFVVAGGFAVLLMSSSAVVFVELLGAIWTFEVVALTGNGKQRSGHEQDGE